MAAFALCVLCLADYQHGLMRPEILTPRPVTVIDAWKALALLLILIDHLGHYIFTDMPLFRVIGRVALPIFFFLLGYARTRTVPLRWLVIGLVLTGVDFLWIGQKGMPLINILFSFAALRLALPWIERFCLIRGWRIFLVMAACIALMPITNPLIEYGTEGWLFGLFGLALRRHHEDSAVMSRLQVALLAVIAGAVFVGVERYDYNFSLGLSGLLAGGMVLVLFGLMRFRPGLLNHQPHGWNATVLRFCGRYNLEIYAAQIILLAALGGALSGLNMIETNADD